LLWAESQSRFSFLFEHDLFRKPVPTFRDHALAVMTVVVMPDLGAVPVAAVADHAMVLMMAAVLARRDDGGHRAERRDHGRGSRRVIVAVIVSAAGAGRQGRGSQCNRGRSSNGDCAAGHNTHFGFLAHVVPSLGSNVDLIKIDRRDSGAANYVFAM
jgi:hypothetical protein